MMCGLDGAAGRATVRRRERCAHAVAHDLPDLARADLVRALSCALLPALLLTRTR